MHRGYTYSALRVRASLGRHHFEPTGQAKRQRQFALGPHERRSQLQRQADAPAAHPSPRGGGA
eukprot:CAMPEP_0185364408 /NCGR_PEP_ID=MMETSP1364-20130426/12382_1 /TAXON_ID=38817 /ORGANISM="Gephyrocapsa oceanica, Strain RCC1303" /LENGTH=62 /DNA_ID=CAMNT_0027964903 /DNA_START=341 /DNA_END=526 /DNA_ORIENTATION=-